MQGFPLDSDIIELDTFKENKMWQIRSEFCADQLIVCLDPKIKEKSVQAFNFHAEDVFICLDTALSDEAKIRLSDQVKLNVI